MTHGQAGSTTAADCQLANQVTESRPTRPTHARLVVRMSGVSARMSRKYYEDATRNLLPWNSISVPHEKLIVYIKSETFMM